jgi:hypothetical protein
MTVEQKITQKNQSTLFEKNPCQELVWQDQLDSIIWAAVFIWAGLVVFMAINLGYSEEQGWSLFFLGAGVLVLTELAVRLLVPAYHNDLFGTLIWAGILFGLGTGSWGLIGPVILIAIGLSILKSINSSRT